MTTITWDDYGTRGCAHCDHGKHPGGRCQHPQARGQTFGQARSLTGACGPEAKFMTFPGLDVDYARTKLASVEPIAPSAIRVRRAAP